MHRPAPRVVVIGERTGGLLYGDLVQAVRVEYPARYLSPGESVGDGYLEVLREGRLHTVLRPEAEYQRDDETRDPEHGRNRIRPLRGTCKGSPSSIRVLNSPLAATGTRAHPQTPARARLSTPRPRSRPAARRASWRSPYGARRGRMWGVAADG